MSDNLSFEQQYLILYEKMHLLCENNKVGDPFSYGRGKEIYMAIKLGHTISPTLSDSFANS